MAQKDGVDWLLHVDTDELIYPSGSPNFSLQVLALAACHALLYNSVLPPAPGRAAQHDAALALNALLRQELLRNVPADVDTLVFPNYESLPERDDVADPFLEVSLFKKNYAHVVTGARAEPPLA